jgi:hypothetical protein
MTDCSPEVDCEKNRRECFPCRGRGSWCQTGSRCAYVVMALYRQAIIVAGIWTLLCGVLRAVDALGAGAGSNMACRCSLRCSQSLFWLEGWRVEHPQLPLSVVPVYLTSLNDSNYIWLYVGARLNSEWVRMWEETAAASYEGQELTNIRKIVNYTRRFPGPPWNCVRAVSGDWKPSDSFRKAQVIERKTQFCSGRWTVCNRFLLSIVSFRDLRPHICFALRLLIPGRPRSLFHALFYTFLCYMSKYFLPYQRIFKFSFIWRLLSYLHPFFLSVNVSPYFPLISSYSHWWQESHHSEICAWRRNSSNNKHVTGCRN